jgi:NitT/TauT family transport system substrate-binding protein
MTRAKVSFAAILLIVGVGLFGWSQFKTRPAASRAGASAPQPATTANRGVASPAPARNIGSGPAESNNGAGDAAPTFSLAWSEYPSWSIFGVAHELGLINGKKGEMGRLEKKWGVDIELRELDYDSCIQQYQAGTVDAACLTNIDVLAPCLSKQSVAILPTSTSYGADALIVGNAITTLKQLQPLEIRGLEKSVSEYFFKRVLSDMGEKFSGYNFKNMDPLAAATSYQSRDPRIPAIVVWQPFVLDTLAKRPDSHKLFDSTKIPAHIIDMVQVAQSSLDKPSGKQFACLVIDTYYSVCRELEKPKKREKMLIMLAEKFAKLQPDQMEQVLKDCRFFSTPEAGLSLLEGGKVMIYAAGSTKPITDDNFSVIMPDVLKFYANQLKLTDKEPTYHFGARDTANEVNLRFDSSYIKAYQARAKADAGE